MAYQTTDWKDILDRANSMVKSQSSRVEMQDALQDVFQLNWDEKFLNSKPAWVQETRDPTAFNAVQSMVDVLSVNEPTPTIEVPKEDMSVENGMGGQMDGMGLLGGNGNGMDMGGMNMGMMGGAMPVGGMQDPLGLMSPMMPQPYDPEKLGETLEGVARAVIKHNDTRREFSLQRDILYSHFIFGQGVVKVADLRLSGLWKPENRASLYGKSPFAIKALRPQYVYYEFDELGLSAVLQRELRSVRELRVKYAKEMDAALFDPDINGQVVYSEWWTRDETCKWIEQAVKNDAKIVGDVESACILEEVKENTLGFIPYVIRSARGTSIFDRDKLFPSLYAGWKSKLFYRANLFLTVGASLAFAMTNPQWLHKSATADKPLVLDFSGPKVYPIGQDESVEKLEVSLPRDVYEMMTLVMGKVEESTVSKVLAGNAPGGVTAASGINLLIQGGKLTIFPIQMAVQETYAEIAQMVFDYVKAYSEFDTAEADGQLKLFLSDGLQTITPDMIPQYLDVTYELKADLPQDKIALVNSALQALGKLVSKETAWDWIGIEDKNKEQARMDADEADALAKQQDQQMQQQMQQQAMQQAQQPPPGSQPGLPSDTLSPNVAQGLPVDRNPQAPVQDIGAMANAMQQAGQPQPQGGM